MNLQLDLRSVWFSFVAMMCVAAALCAQNFVAVPPPTLTESPRIITNRRQLEALALSHTRPEYPPVAKVNYLEGQVQIEVTVNDRGHVSSTHVLQGNPILACAALQAVNQWVYRPLATTTGPSGFIAFVKLRFLINHPSVHLSSKQAERDFQRQVKPPRILTASNEMASDGVVHMRLLVNDEGQVIDRDSKEMDKAQFKAACENLRGWTFAPARWGTMPVASYLNVDVPVVPPPVTRAAANPIVH